MIKIFLAIFFAFTFYVAAAQVTIQGKIIDQNNKPIKFVIVSLDRDAQHITDVISDSTGKYLLNNIKKGNYILRFKFVAYQDTSVKVVIKADTSINIKLKNKQMLSEVVIKARKPVFERQIDRFRFNVGGTDLSIGNNIWDVLEKTPLITVSEDGSVAISGTTGAVVYLNNKKKILSGTALKSYLSGLPSDNLEAIEVMTTPPSQYEADGGAGIINIVTKKNKEEGLIGTASLSTRQTAVNSEAGSIYLNERSGKWNVYSTFYMGNRSRKPITDRDILFPAGTPNSIIQRTIHSDNQYQELYPGTSVGADYQINKNQVVGLLFDYSGNWHKETRNAASHDFYSTVDSLSQTNNKDNINSQTYALNLNYQGKLDSAGKTLSIDYDALAYRSGNNSNSSTTELDPLTGSSLYPVNSFRTSSPQNINNQSLKADFSWPVSKKVNLSLGGKTSFSKINNNFLFENLVSGNFWVTDPGQSNNFRYNENINSLYGNLSYRMSTAWSYQLGVRLENTIATGWLEDKEVVDRNYTNVFPTVFVKWTTPKKGSYVLALTSRITRPGYWDLNPFRKYTTDQSYFEGNPLLNPVKYYRQELTHSFSGKSGTLTLQLAASQTIGEIYALPYNSGDTIINKKTNYGNRYGYSTTASYNDQFLSWWRFSGTAVFGYVATRGTYANNIVINNNTLQLTLSTNQTFTISKKAGLSSTLFISNSFPGTIVNTHIGNRLDTEIRLRKTAGPFNITLSAQDLLKSNQDRYTYTLGALNINDNYYNDTRSVALALAYNFGKQTVKDRRDREIGSQDVKGRLI